jgi:hypothetical protein
MKNKRLELVVLLASYYGAAACKESGNCSKYVLIITIQSNYVHAC